VKVGSCCGIETVCGTVFGVEAPGVFSFGFTAFGNGGGSSGGGNGRPLATAMSWLSVHESSRSFNPFQNGASRRSICQELAHKHIIQIAYINEPSIAER
jgi:hypothetical protein